MMFFFLVASFAAEPVSTRWSDEARAEGSVSYVAVMNGSLYKAPAADSEEVAKLPLASKVTLVKRGEKLKVGERTATWFEVITEKGQKGFLWGGHLTDAVVVEDLNQDGKKETIVAAFNSKHELEVFAAIGGKKKVYSVNLGLQLDVMDGAERLFVQVLPAKKAGAPLLLVNSVGGEYCGSLDETYYLSLGKKQLVSAFSVVEMSDPPYSSSNKVEFQPASKQITVTQSTWFYDDDREEEVLEDKSVSVYHLKKGIFELD